MCLVLAIIAAHGPLAKWRQAREERRQAEQREQLAFPLTLTSDAGRYARYALVRLTLGLRDAAGRPVVTRTPPRILVYRDGDTGGGRHFVETVGGVGQLIPRYDAGKQVYECRWPVPWNCPPGRYVAEARWRIADPEAWLWRTAEDELRLRREKPGHQEKEPKVAGEGTCVARAHFEVAGRPPPNQPPGQCVATWEEALPLAGSRIPRPDGRMGDWRAMLDWCEFIGADTLWVRGAVTQAGATPLTLEQPFVPTNLQALPVLAAEAHRRGLKFGAWAAAFATLPDDPRTKRRKPRYIYSKDVSRSTGVISDTAFVSFLDKRREDHLVGFFKAMEADPNVDHIGLDYLRTEPGYELTERFAREMPVKLPRDWGKMDRVARWKYVAERAERQRTDEDRAFYDAWNWYRAHLGAEIAARLITRSQVKKPVWLFSLSWLHGVQHGQDPLMFTDAGVALICPMLYQIDVQRFPFIIRDWRRYMKSGQANLLCGDQVDNYWHQGLGPQELLRRMLEAHHRLLPDGRTQGGYWHDISRAAVSGNLGPYSGVEWALAGGAAFSRIRQSWRVYPLRAELHAPQACGTNTTFGVELELTSLAEKTIRRIRIQPFSAGSVRLERREVSEVAELKPGERLQTPFTARIGSPVPARRGTGMVAFRITWPDGEYGEQVRRDLPRVIIVVAYIKTV